MVKLQLIILWIGNNNEPPTWGLQQMGRTEYQSASNPLPAYVLADE